MNRFFLIGLLAFFIIGCKSNKNIDAITGVITPIETNSIEFMTKETGGDYIVEGDTEGFFDYLSIVDMKIQMKTQKDYADKAGALKDYKALLRSEAMDFLPEEEKFLEEVFDTARVMINKVNPAVFPKGLKIIKINTNHYGSDVYYTRGKAILIPANIFEYPSVERQLPVMLHEIFHIFSRYNHSTRDDLYGLVGFKNIGQTPELPKSIAQKLLVNPDGVSMNHVIDLKDKNTGQTVRALPLITSSKSDFSPEIPSFFSYLKFDLYKVQEENGKYLVPEDNYTLKMGEYPDFFTQIKDNTQYIIHPDEIMADNFMLAVMANHSGNYKKFSKSGVLLLESVLEILKKYK